MGRKCLTFNHVTILLLIAAILCLPICSCSDSPPEDTAQKGTIYVDKEKYPAITQSRLLMELPDICPTPDGMAIDSEGNLIIACPNYGDQAKPAILMKLDKANKLELYASVPQLAETKLACPMGIDFGPDGDIFICDNQGWMKPNDLGRILRLKIADGKVIKTTVVAEGMAHPNGVKVRNDKVYVTQSMMPKVKSDKLTSAVYCFDVDDENVKVENTLEDKNLLISFQTQNPDCQYGLDGLVFDSKGNLYVGNFGDGSLHKITLDEAGKVTSNSIYAKSPAMRTTDGICIDAEDNIYVADFSENAVCKVSTDGSVQVIARSPDCDGSKGGLDQPGEPIVWEGKLVVTCFDMVTGPDKVNTKHDKPSTIAYIDMEDVK